MLLWVAILLFVKIIFKYWKKDFFNIANTVGLTVFFAITMCGTSCSIKQENCYSRESYARILMLCPLILTCSSDRLVWSPWLGTQTARYVDGSWTRRTIINIAQGYCNDASAWFNESCTFTFISQSGIWSLCYYLSILLMPRRRPELSILLLWVQTNRVWVRNQNPGLLQNRIHHKNVDFQTDIWIIQVNRM